MSNPEPSALPQPPTDATGVLCRRLLTRAAAARLAGRVVALAVAAPVRTAG